VEEYATMQALRTSPKALRSQSLIAVMTICATMPSGSGARAQESGQRTAAAAQSANGEGEPFTAAFSNGVKIELVGVSVNPSEGQPWWTPDGMRMEKAPYATARVFITPGPNQIAREICWRWSNLPDDPDFEKRWEIDPSSNGGGGGRAWDANGQPIADLAAHAVTLPSTDGCTLRFKVSIGATPWKTSITGDVRPSTTSGTFDGVRQAAVFGESIFYDGGTLVTVSYRIPERTVRLVAVDRAGKTHTESSTQFGSVNDFIQATYRFAGIAPADIERFELQTQTRQFETIEFRGVSLHLGKYENVDIVRISPDGQEERLPVAGMSKVLVEQTRNSPEAKAAEQQFQRMQALLKTMATDDGYRLEANQRFKHVPPPYSAAREAYLSAQSAMMGRRGAARVAILSQPTFMTLRWVDDRLTSNRISGAAPTVKRVLDGVFGIKLHRIEGGLSLLSTELPGDWVVSWDPQRRAAGAEESDFATAEDIEALERILQDELLEIVDLELREVSRPAYVMKGDFKFSPIRGPDGKLSGLANLAVDGPIQIPARRTSIVASIVSYQEFLETLSELLMVPVFDETTTRPSKPQMVLQFSGTPLGDELIPFELPTIESILASITAQTGFTFVKEERPVKMLFIKRGVRE
jgi:hypothetical protein